MLSSFSRIKLPNELEPLTFKPLLLPELLINELSSEDILRFFGYHDDNFNYMFGNDYYCGAVLKLCKSMFSESFESSVNYVNS